MVKKKTAGSDSTKDEEVLKYMKKVNRPYSATDVFNNLHATCSKSHIVKALNNLVDDGDLISKTYGKSTIYSLKQDTVEENVGSNTLGSEVNKLTEELNLLQNENKKLEEGNCVHMTSHSILLETFKITNRISKEKAIESIKQFKEANQDLQERLDKLKSGSVLIPPEKRKRTDKDFEYNRNAWKKRRRIFNTIFEAVTEHMPTKPNEFREKLGIEEDEIPFEIDPLEN
ncbi:unnamed protein product [Rhizopus stolonifer]